MFLDKLQVVQTCEAVNQACIKHRWPPQLHSVPSILYMPSILISSCTSIVYRLYCSLPILCTGCACQLIIKDNDDDDDRRLQFRSDTTAYSLNKTFRLFLIRIPSK